jgi:hypothetical protein
VEAELRQQLERLARAEDRPLSYLVRRVLRAEAARAQTQERGVTGRPSMDVPRAYHVAARRRAGEGS